MRVAAVALLVIGIVLAPGCRKTQSARGWAKTFGGAGNEWGSSVQQTRDGGFIVAGATTSFGAGDVDMWLIKTDGLGKRVWDRTFGGAGYDHGNSVLQTKDGGYIVAGTTRCFGAGSEDVWLIKTDASGKRVWDRAFGGARIDRGNSVRQTSDGGYIVAGETGLGEVMRGPNSDLWLIKTDAEGNKVWDKVLGGAGYEIGNEVQQTRDGGYVVVGSAESDTGYPEAWLMKLDSAGVLAWSRTYGRRPWNDGHSVQQAQDGGYVFTGTTTTHDTMRHDVWLVRTDSVGDTVWTRTFGGPSTDFANSIRQTRDGGYIMTGGTEAGRESRQPDVWLIKTDAGGDTTWTRIFGRARGDHGNSLQQTNDGGYIIVGSTESHGAGGSDVWLIKTDAEGRVDEGGGK